MQSPNHIHIMLNGRPETFPSRTTVAELVVRQGLAKQRIAIELNGNILPRSEHGNTALNDNDVIEIVHAIGGG